MLIVLCRQLAKDGWGTNILRLSKICDIAELLRSQPDLDWPCVLAEAEKLGCQYILSFGLSVSPELLGAEVPAFALRKLPSPSFDTLFDHIMDKLFNQNAPFYPGRMGSGRFHFRIRERWRDRFDPYVYSCKRAVLPNDRDEGFVRLPKQMYPLYYIIRRVNLLRECFRPSTSGVAGRDSRRARWKND